MASSKLLLPSSAALFQSAPFSSTPLFLDKHRYVLLPSAPLRSFVLQTQTFDSALTARFSSDGEEALTFEGAVTSSEDEGEDTQEEEEEEKEEEVLHVSTSSGTSASTTPSDSDVKGTLSKYIWTRPRRQLPSLSREERAAVVDSLLNNRSSLLVALDK